MTAEPTSAGPAGNARRPSGDSGDQIADLVARHTLDVPDYPKPGILFKDLSPLFSSGPALAATAEAIVATYGPAGFEVVAGIEARGFIVAAAVAMVAGVGVVPIRKAGKLPRTVVSASYDLEYGQATIEVHADAVAPGQRVLLVDDVLATGGTAQAALGLIDQLGGLVVGFSVLLELGFLSGRKRLERAPGNPAVHSLLIA
ncbi:MAG: adenine phosphoribosyltransferase [Micromonosporaceae bacterium]|nr:adenine phosphoribosyltransferase [Micromonosporaceae bacterium]